MGLLGSLLDPFKDQEEQTEQAKNAGLKYLDDLKAQERANGRLAGVKVERDENGGYMVADKEGHVLAAPNEEAARRAIQSGTYTPVAQHEAAEFRRKEYFHNLPGGPGVAGATSFASTAMLGIPDYIARAASSGKAQFRGKYLNDDGSAKAGFDVLPPGEDDAPIDVTSAGGLSIPTLPGSNGMPDREYDPTSPNGKQEFKDAVLEREHSMPSNFGDQWLEYRRGLQEEYPKASMVGDVAAMVTDPAGLATAAGRKAAIATERTATGGPVAVTAAVRGNQAAAEGMVQAVQQTAQKSAISEHPLGAESIAAQFGYESIMAGVGGAVGAGFGALGGVIKKIRMASSVAQLHKNVQVLGDAINQVPEVAEAVAKAEELRKFGGLMTPDDVASSVRYQEDMDQAVTDLIPERFHIKAKPTPKEAEPALVDMEVLENKIHRTPVDKTAYNPNLEVVYVDGKRVVREKPGVAVLDTMDTASDRVHRGRAVVGERDELLDELMHRQIETPSHLDMDHSPADLARGNGARRLESNRFHKNVDTLSTREKIEYRGRQSLLTGREYPLLVMPKNVAETADKALEPFVLKATSVPELIDGASQAVVGLRKKAADLLEGLRQEAKVTPAISGHRIPFKEPPSSSPGPLFPDDIKVAGNARSVVRAAVLAEHAADEIAAKVDRVKAAFERAQNPPRTVVDDLAARTDVARAKAEAASSLHGPWPAAVAEDASEGSSLLGRGVTRMGRYAVRAATRRVVGSAIGGAGGYAIGGMLGAATGMVTGDLVGQGAQRYLFPMFQRFTRNTAERLTRAIQSSTIPTPRVGRHLTLMKILTRPAMGVDDEE